MNFLYEVSFNKLFFLLLSPCLSATEILEKLLQDITTENHSINKTDININKSRDNAPGLILFVALTSSTKLKKKIFTIGRLEKQLSTDRGSFAVQRGGLYLISSMGGLIFSGASQLSPMFLKNTTFIFTRAFLICKFIGKKLT